MKLFPLSILCLVFSSVISENSTCDSNLSEEVVEDAQTIALRDQKFLQFVTNNPQIRRDFRSLEHVKYEVTDVCTNADGSAKRIKMSEKHGMTKIFEHFCKLDISAIRKKLDDAGPEAFKFEGRASNAEISFRNNNVEKFKPGVETIFLMFSDGKARNTYRFPWFYEYLPVLTETVFKPLNIDPRQIARLQFAKMGKGASILPHSDRGAWAQAAHRVHVPILSYPEILFVAREKNNMPVGMKIPSKEGIVFEINNLSPHFVHNFGDGDRIHLIIDWVEHKVQSINDIKVGSNCFYDASVGLTCSGGFNQVA